MIAVLLFGLWLLAEIAAFTGRFKILAVIAAVIAVVIIVA